MADVQNKDVGCRALFSFGLCAELYKRKEGEVQSKDYLRKCLFISKATCGENLTCDRVFKEIDKSISRVVTEWGVERYQLSVAPDSFRVMYCNQSTNTCEKLMQCINLVEPSRNILSEDLLNKPTEFMSLFDCAEERLKLSIERLRPQMCKPCKGIYVEKCESLSKEDRDSSLKDNQKF